MTNPAKGNIVEEAIKVVANASTTVKSFVAATGGKGADLLTACDATQKSLKAIDANDKQAKNSRSHPGFVAEFASGSSNHSQSNAPKAGL
ncbi:MAG: hypothetical protein HON55_00730 [Legionellales bacterium]|jgi:hypothetical protein|nr:hypothetical protein [Legionellales bacterium]